MDRTPYELPKDCDFMKISNVPGENECTPRLLDSAFFPYVGILINGPEEVVWPRNASPEDYPLTPWGETSGPLRLMVAGLVKVKYPKLGLDGAFGPEVLVVAVDQESAEVYSGKMEIPEISPPPEPDFLQPEVPTIEADRDAPAASTFNVDLVYNLGIPVSDATYIVYATFGDYKSNILTIKARVE